MEKQKSLDRPQITALVVSSLSDALSRGKGPSFDAVEESTHLIGRGSVLDSLGLVTLIVDLEQRLEEEYGVSVVLANDRAISQKNSPFRTVQSLTEYICLLIEEQR